MGGLFIKLDEACSFRVCFVGDLLAFVKFEQGSRVQLSQLTLGWAEPSDEREGRRIVREEGWAVAEELVFGVELSVDLKAYFQADCGIVYGRLGSLH